MVQETPNTVLLGVTNVVEKACLGAQPTALRSIIADIYFVTMLRLWVLL